MMSPNQHTMYRRVLARTTDTSPPDPSIFNQPARDEFRRIDGNRKANSLGRPDHGGIDSDDVTVRRDQRSPGIARIQRGIGLDNVIDQPAGLRSERTAERAHHTGRDGRLKAIGVANGNDQLADRIDCESPSLAGFGFGAVMRTTARSVSGSSPTLSASYRSPSGRVTSILFAPYTT